MRLLCLAILHVALIDATAQSFSLDPTFNPQDVGFGKGDGGLATIDRILEEPNGDLILFRGMRHLDGLSRTEMARIHPDGSIDPDFEPAASLGNTNRSVLDIARLSDGKLVIVGDYSSFAGQPSSGVTRLFPDGSVDPDFTANLLVPTRVRVLPDDKVLVQHTGYLSRLLDDGSIDPDFQSTGPANIENVLVLQDGRILFANSTTNNQRILTMLLPDGSVDTSFDQSGVFDLYLNDMVALPDGGFLVCGAFSHWNEIPVKALVRLNADGSLDTSFEPVNATESLTTAQTLLVEANGDLLVSCTTTSDNGTFTGLRRLSPDGTIDPDLRIHFNFLPRQILRQSNGGTIAVGYFQHVNGHYRRSIVRLHPNGEVDRDLLPGTGAQGEINHVTTLADGRILIGGILQGYDGLSVPNLLRLNEDGSHDETFDPGTGPMAANSSQLAVHTISTQPDGKYLVGGFFQAFNGQPASGLVRLHDNGALDDSFRVDQLTGTVSGSLVLPNGMVLASGRFGTTPNAPASRANLVRLLADGTVDPDFNASIQQSIYGNIHRVLLLPDGDLLVAGFFNAIGGMPCANLGRLDPNGTLDAAFDADIAFQQWEEATAMAVQNDGRIIVATSFGRLFRLLPNGSLDTSFTSGSGFAMTFAPVAVRDIVLLPDDRIVIGGRFSSYNGDPCGHFICLNSDGSLNATFETGTGFFNYLGPAPFDVWANVVKDLEMDTVGRLLAVGAFTEYDGVGRNRIARFGSDLTTGIHTELPDRHIHPNPSFGTFLVRTSSGPSTIEIMDTSGRIVHQQRYARGPTSDQIDLSHQPPGAYFARIHTTEGTFSEQLMIVR